MLAAVQARGRPLCSLLPHPPHATPSSSETERSHVWPCAVEVTPHKGFCNLLKSLFPE